MIYLATDLRREISSCNVNFSPEGYLHPDRTMKEYDFLYMVEGSWDIYEQNAEGQELCYHLDPGKLLILEPGRHHFSYEKSTPNMRNMYLHCNRLPGDGLDTGGCLKLSKLSDCSSNHQITNLYEQIIEAYWSLNPYRQLRTASLLDLFLTELALLEESELLSHDYLTREIIQRFNSQPDRFFSPGDLAEDYHCNVRTLSGRFRKATGMSLHQYQLKLKLSMAHEQIPLCPGRGLRDIALSFGFYDEFQFSKLYKRQFGYPPSRRR
ncbi:MAG: helix-turn-helix transcriptional regulator [Lachnospiraceae bacterium]|nr:helix-turn-helix transcriptional regulator [Lachnospiraceae bacterium]